MRFNAMSRRVAPTPDPTPQMRDGLPVKGRVSAVSVAKPQTGCGTSTLTGGWEGVRGAPMNQHEPKSIPAASCEWILGSVLRSAAQFLRDVFPLGRNAGGGPFAAGAAVPVVGIAHVGFDPV